MNFFRVDRIQHFPSNVLHTKKTRIENGFERIRINTVTPCYLETADLIVKPLLWYGTSLYQIENGLERIAMMLDPRFQVFHHAFVSRVLD